MRYTLNNDLLFYNGNIACQRHVLAEDLDNIDLFNDNNFNEDDPDSIIHVKLLAWHRKSKKRKALKKR